MHLTSKYTSLVLFTLILFISITCLLSCDDEHISTDTKLKLEFSTDTVSFDTVFTTLGSATKKVMVYNRNKHSLIISDIKLKSGTNSTFKINVDGIQSKYNQFENIEIRANDSMFVFVTVTINPTNNNSPVFIEDSLTFVTNGNKQTVKLHAYGQDMEILRGLRVNDNTILKNDKPYLIYDSLVILKNKTLTINPGTKLYFHNNANLIAYGNLIANGTIDKPILFRGDRLDKIMFSTPFEYNNVAGQWGGIYLLGNSGNHILNYVNINSGYVGVFLQNEDRKALSSVTISNSKIHNFLFYGLVVQNGNATVTNSEISNTGSYSVYLNGGKHSFTHCTIANYFNNSNVQPSMRDKKPAVMIMNLNKIAEMESYFYNCVIDGSATTEFSLISEFIDLYKGKFDHCYLKSNSKLSATQFTNIRFYNTKDTIFKSIKYDLKKKTYFNFTPDSLSPLRGLASKTIAEQYPIDLNGKSRLSDNEPDAGAYEWTPTKK